MCAAPQHTPLDEVDREQLAEGALDILGVVEARELMTGARTWR